MLNIIYNIFIFPIELLIEVCFTFALRVTQNYGFSIIILSFTVSTLILPLYMIAEKLQQIERDKQNLMKEMKDIINAVFKGDKRYLLLSTLYRQHNYHPVYALRSSLGLLIQVPFFIAAYHFLSNLEILNGQSFLFIRDLGAPDKLFAGINFLPILMTLINIVSGAIYTKGLSRQEKIQVYVLAAVFLVLLYNSPAALVFYWTCNNIYNLVKNILIKNKNADKVFYILTLLIGGILIFYIVLMHQDLFINRLLNIFILLLILSVPFWKRIFTFIRLKTILFFENESQSFYSKLFILISVLPPGIFMFYILSKNVVYVYYTHVLIITVIFSLTGFIMHLLVSRIGKSAQGSALAFLFLWIVFFTVIMPIYNVFLINLIFNLRYRYQLIIVMIPFLALSILVLKLGARIKKAIFFKYLAVLLSIVFLFNFIQGTINYLSENTYQASEADYKTSFFVDTETPSPNIYWLFMDGMLGFKAMDYFFDDPQIEFEEQLKERGFVVNMEAELEIGYTTIRAIPALMSPFYYDKVMAPILESDPIDYTRRKDFNNSIFKINSNSLLIARLYNELINSFNAKSYKTIQIGYSGLIWPPITKIFYTSNGRIDYNIKNIKNIENLDKTFQLLGLLKETTPIRFISDNIDNFLNYINKRRINTEEIKMSEIDKTKFYGSFYEGSDTWIIDALSETFEIPTPRLIIIDDQKAHSPFILSENGSLLPRRRSDFLKIINYPPQHQYIRKYLMNLIDFILVNDQNAIIVVQSDHGLQENDSRIQILSSGGTPHEVSMIYNQTMNAILIPDMWGGLDEPLDPLNITRLLINRYVGQNYELLE